jgi:hypothetical protein
MLANRNIKDNLQAFEIEAGEKNNKKAIAVELA